MPTHASFFSGAGGLDIGLERAGWTTVSFSEIDPYASAVLAQRWPGVPNLGDIVSLARRDRDAGADLGGSGSNGWAHGARADLWTGGFPCQDLSVAGKRRGMGTADARTRSGLAWAFLGLVEQHRPPAILLENVPGLLSSNAGRDFGALLREMGELGYGWAYRVLDARHFGVPQRRRRVFILGIHARVDPSGTGAAEVLSVGSRCPGHPATGHEAGPGAADRAVPGVDIARTVVGTAGKRHDEDIDTLIPELVGALNDLGHHGWTANAQSVAQGHIIGASPDAGRDGAPDGLAGRLDDRVELAPTLRVGGRASGAGSSYDNTPIIAFTKSHNVDGRDSAETWVSGREARSMNGFDGDRTTLVIGESADDPLLPIGLDSHRYRCCGNGVVSGVSEWIGERLAGYLA